MKAECDLSGSDLILRTISIEDCNATYVDWLNNPEITGFLVGVRNHVHDLDGVRRFVQSVLESENAILFAIVDRQSNRHIGNIKIGPIDWSNESSHVSLFIGEREFWGKGYASQAISLVVSYGFTKLGLNRLEAGVVDGNSASLKAFLRNGFREEGLMRRAFKWRDDYQDNRWLALLRDEWENLSAPRGA
ncbi:GNAT family protein [Magnetovibrio sp.]|uniref:GNAT family N-acetyltransferase n=1 Tax=Magnetovibrio sp. TaxID=2024836 RepID=UPI002F953B6D